MGKLLLIWGEFAAAARAQPCPVSPAVPEPLLVRAAIELGLTNTLPH